MASLQLTARRRSGRESTHRSWLAGAVGASVAVGLMGGTHPLYALLAIVFVGGTYLTISRPFYGTLALALLTPITSATKSGLLIPHLRLSQALIIWLAPLVILFAKRPVPRWGALEWLGLAYAGATLLLGSFDLWRQDFPFSSSSVDTLIGPFQYLLLLRATRIGVRSEAEVALVVRVLLLAAVPVCLLALLQGFGVTWAQDFAHNVTGLNEGHLNRAVGVFTNWQVLAGYLLAVGLISVAVASYGAGGILRPRAATALSILIALALARTLTIGAFAGFLLASAALLVMSGRVHLTVKRVTVWCGLAVLVLALVLAARYSQEFVTRPGEASNGIVPNTVMDRVHNWTQQYLPALAGRWVTGYGPGIPSNASWRSTDSVYVTIILRGGLVLLGIYAALMSALARVAKAVHISDTTAERKSTGAALLTLVIMLFPLQTIATYFTTSGLPEVTWLLAAVVAINRGSP